MAHHGTTGAGARRYYKGANLVESESYYQANYINQNYNVSKLQNWGFSVEVDLLDKRSDGQGSWIP